jgi:hypothetical protein
MPEIYWYLFWVGLVLILTGLFIWGGVVAQRRSLEVLEILRSYADKGVEPPPALAEQLAKHVFSPPAGAKADRMSRAALLRGFLGALFTACVAWGVSEWIAKQGGAGWALYASWAAWAFFGFAAFGLLLAALTTRD